MPFTLSHPAIVLPLARGRMVPSALVAGSIAPDLPYFVGQPEQRGLTHEFTSVLTLDLGLAMAFLGIFHVVLKWPLVALSPAWIRRRVTAPARAFDERRFGDLGWLLVSAVVGACSHVGWDSFTHPGAPGVRLFPVLAEPLVLGLPGLKVAQYASGVIGLLVIVGWTAWWSWHATPSDEEPPGLPVRTRAVVLGSMVVAGAAGGCYGALTWVPPRFESADLHSRLVGGSVGSIALATFVLIAYGLVFRRGGGLGGST